VEVSGSCKHSSLLQYGYNYCRKKFYSAGPWTIFTSFDIIYTF